VKTLFLSMLSLLLSVSPSLAEQSSGNSSAPAAHEGFAYVDGKNILAPDGKLLLLRGINLGNWLLPEGYMFKLEHTTAHWQIAQLFKELVGPADALAFWHEWYDNYITKDDIEYIKALGLNSIRVPFNYKLLTPEDYPGVWLGPGFDLLDRVIAWSKEVGLYVILDMHAAPGGQTGTNIDDSAGHPWLFESQACQERTVEVWRKIAERYGGEKTVLGYDLLNEPIPHFEGYERFFPLLEPLYKRIVTAVREVDANHIIFLGGAVWDTNFDVFGPSFADNLAYTFHKYWMEPVQKEIQSFLDFREKYSVPIWLGESGENTDEWVASFRQLLEKNNVGWCFWPFKKMDSQSCIRTFDVPPFWDEIAVYAKERNLDPGQIKDHRPPIEHSRQALAGLLRNIRFEHNRVNDGYIKALGL
jgi:endoglucanase